MPPVPAEKLLMFARVRPSFADDPFPILLPNPKDPELFQPLLFSNRPLTDDQRDDFYLPSSLCRQGPARRPVRMGVCCFSKDLFTFASSAIGESTLAGLFALPLTFSIATSFAVSHISSVSSVARSRLVYTILYLLKAVVVSPCCRLSQKAAHTALQMPCGATGRFSTQQFEAHLSAALA
jgi:hypothetical protein